MSGRSKPKVRCKTALEVEHMCKAGEIVSRALQAMRDLVSPGVTTIELDRVAEAFIRDSGAIPSFKGYHNYPATICASVNETIVHGIPGKRRLIAGDIVSLDVGAIWEGYHGDAAISVAVGPIDGDLERLLEATRSSLAAGIKAARVGERLGDVSHAIETVARRTGFEVIREYGGHGIGRQMHEPPRIPNWGRGRQGMKLEAGMTFALEPMLSLGGYETQVLADGWAVVTADKSVTAHFEHTIVVTESGGEILTRVVEAREAHSLCGG